MEIDIRVWLEGIGFGNYADAFEENCVDGEVLAHLTSDDLRDIGVFAVGHRRKLLRAIEKLAGVPEETPETVDAGSLARPAEQHASERRQVTVLFADICGFTNLSSSIDSEDVHSLLAVYFEIADGIIKDYGGTVDKHVGDSVMAVFGAPISHGNDAERAVRAAVAIQNAMPRISDRLGRPLQTHIGIACGEVVASGVGPDSHYTVIGDSVNLAARLTDKAQAGEVFVSDVVRQSISGYLATEDVGEVSVKGLSAPVQVFSVLGPNARPESRQTRPLVGRAAEIRQFQISLEGCQDASQGQLIQIRGDAGIGKTRLTDEFYRMASNSGFTCNRSLILDFGVGQGQDPIRSLVRSLLDISSDEEDDALRVAASEAISNGIVPAEKEVYLRDLLNVPQASEGQALYDAMDNMTRNAGKIETVVALVRTLSARHPQLIIFEDVHWADKLVLEHIARLGRGVVDVPVILVLTSRIEGDPINPAWRGLVAGTPFMTLDLGPLSEADAMGLTESFVQTTNKFAQSCIQRAAGNPLFLEQLLRSAPGN